MTDDEALAQSVRYSSAHTWLFAEFVPGKFALFNAANRELELITDDWAEVLAHYRARPPYIPPVRRTIPAIDLSKIEIDL